MNATKYFYINNQKFNYNLEFQNNHVHNYWKHNAPLIDYCETLGITIPHYCYHKNLSISGNCRMCLVELKNSPKPMVSCAMSAKSCLNNNEIFTDSPLVKKARENILEFLLLNHPLDCPICDQGGECDLQDQSLYFGITKKRFYNFKRIVTDKNIGPIVKTVMTRCIHCTRCVRFSAEIAGTEELGMFGRGLDSEIGTYVQKSFQSELSGNVIDLCPVGALTSKPYPFLSRSWELKTTNSIDFADGFGTNVQISLKNNKVVKVTPSYCINSKNNQWISDKTRFSFDGMFAPNKITQGFVNFGSTRSATGLTWKTLITEIVITLYFQDHLSKHCEINNTLLIIFNDNVSLEVLNLLQLFSKNYSFIKLRRLDETLSNTDLPSTFLLTPLSKLNKSLIKSKLCLLIGTNTRYEGVNLNLNLRNRFLKGDFEILTVGSTNQLTFPTTDLGVNIKLLKTIVEGNNSLCQKFVNLSNPLVISSSNVLKRSDSKGFLMLLSEIEKHLKKYHKNWNGINLLSGSLNEVGVKYLNAFKTLTVKDTEQSCGTYFINTQGNNLNLKKILNIKLLNYNTNSLNYPTYSINQTFLDSPKVLDAYNTVNLPNTSFYESTGKYVNAEGIFKNSVKFITTTSQNKEDWQIVRKIFNTVKRVSFVNNVKDNSLISFNTQNFLKFRNFTSYLYESSITLDKKSTISPNILVKTSIKTQTSVKSSKYKILSTKFKNWINDFYIGGSDSYSKYSTTMIACSNNLRLEKNNFSHLI